MFNRAISVLPMGAIDARQRLKETYEQAKAMHEQETKDAHENGMSEGYYFEGSRSDWESEGVTKYFAEQYYKDTFA